jgi:enamine deaminase RidA (YjgF/YER057c/UK114 family)
MVSSVSVQRINPGALPRPSGFSHAVSAAAATTVYLAGQTGTDRDGALVPGGVVPQFEQALANLLTALAAAGGRPQDLASLTIYLTDIEDYQAHSQQIGAIWRRLAGPHYPAMAAVGVTRLWDPQALVELQGVAALPVLHPKPATQPSPPPGCPARRWAGGGRRPDRRSHWPLQPQPYAVRSPVRHNGKITGDDPSVGEESGDYSAQILPRSQELPQ